VFENIYQESITVENYRLFFDSGVPLLWIFTNETEVIDSAPSRDGSAASAANFGSLRTMRPHLGVCAETRTIMAPPNSRIFLNQHFIFSNKIRISCRYQLCFPVFSALWKAVSARPYSHVHYF
jgi:hypothetical protein